jgi:hypothetical protein
VEDAPLQTRRRRRSRAGVRYRSTEEIAALLESRAATFFAIVIWADAEAAGLTTGTVRRLCESGRWIRKGGGVYVVARMDGGPLQEAAIQLVRAGGRAFLQRVTAAFVQGGMDLEWDGTVDIAGLPGSTSRVSRRDVPRRHLVVVGGLCATDGLQTLLDLAAVLDDVQWEWALEAALRRKPVKGKRRLPPLTTMSAIEEALAAPGRKDRASVARVRRVLALRPPGAPATDSLLETLFIQLCRDVGAPVPERQVPVTLPDGTTVHADVAWPDLGLFIELDGQGHVGQPVHDSWRRGEIVAATGWLYATFTWTEVFRNPKPSGRRLLRILDQARRRPLLA